MYHVSQMNSWQWIAAKRMLEYCTFDLGNHMIDFILIFEFLKILFTVTVELVPECFSSKNMTIESLLFFWKQIISDYWKITNRISRYYIFAFSCLQNTIDDNVYFVVYCNYIHLKYLSSNCARYIRVKIFWQNAN